jgi:hypothetical protein
MQALTEAAIHTTVFTDNKSDNTVGEKSHLPFFIEIKGGNKNDG